MYDNYERLGMPKIGPTSYTDKFNREQKEYLLTKIQTFDLITEVISPHRTVPEDRQDFHQGRI